MQYLIPNGYVNNWTLSRNYSLPRYQSNQQALRYFNCSIYSYHDDYNIFITKQSKAFEMRIKNIPFRVSQSLTGREGLVIANFKIYLLFVKHGMYTN